MKQEFYRQMFMHYHPFAYKRNIEGICPYSVFCPFRMDSDLIGISEIEKKYNELGGNQGLLGLPIGPEQLTPDGIGRYQRFQFGNIYWSPSYGAHVVPGIFLREYEKIGGTKGMLGFPAMNPTALQGVEGGIISRFKGGNIIYEPGKGVSVDINIRKL